MKIAVIASIWISVPPVNFGFGAQEYLAYQIVEGLVKKGHQVTLFATGDSKTTAKLISVSPQQVKNIETTDLKIKDTFELLNLAEAFRDTTQYDVVHNHLLPYGTVFSQFSKCPVIHTLHHEIKKTKADCYLYEKYKSQNYVSISNAQRNSFPQLNYVQTIYNGIDTNIFKFKEAAKNDYFLYIGRVKKYKGIHTAIGLAKKMGFRLKIATPTSIKSQPDYAEIEDYWTKEIAPHIGGNIEHILDVTEEQKVNLYQNAKALLFPLERAEPFGMTVIEAMSCGTPVISYALGSIPEIIYDGATGYLVNPKAGPKRVIANDGITGFEDAIRVIQTLKEPDYQRMRKNCRTIVDKSFTIEKMVDAYEELYKRVKSNP